MAKDKKKWEQMFDDLQKAMDVVPDDEWFLKTMRRFNAVKREIRKEFKAIADEREQDGIEKDLAE